MISRSTLAATAVTLGLIAAAPVHAGITTFEVNAQTHSTAFNSHDASPLDTGLSFSTGDALTITSTGLWNGGGCGDVTAEGTTCFGNDPVTGFNYFSLVGRVGNGDYFRIGNSYQGQATSSGHLFLAFLDTDSFNNFGSQMVNVSSVPEPGTWALALAGLAGLGLARRRQPQPR